VEDRVDEDYKRAIALCKGSYQVALIDGRQNWSGSDLKGKARKYGSHYNKSRIALLSRLEAAGVAFIERIEHGRLRFRFGRPVGNYVADTCNCGPCWKKGIPTVLDKLVEEAASD
jgi:hypothetical protein